MTQIILVDDDADDRYFFKTACKKLSFPVDACTFESGYDFLAFESEYNVRNSIVLLDLNMQGGLNGVEVLEKLQEKGAAQTLIIIIYTTSTESKDMEQCYQLGAKSFVTKPSTINKVTELLDSLHAYWCIHNLMPTSR